MRVLLTGATGFIGTHTLGRLVAAGHTVRALYRARPGVFSSPAVEWVQGDLLDPATLTVAAAACEAIIHTAAELANQRQSAAHQRAVNVEGTRHIVEAAVTAGVRRLVFTSSIAAIGAPPLGRLADETFRYDWPPGLPYNESKRDSERVALGAAAQLEVVVLSPAWVLGPESPRAHQRLLLRALRFGGALFAPAGGTTICDVRDVADGHVAALTQGRAGERYILGGPRLTYRQLWTLFASALGALPPLATIPALWMRATALPLIVLESHLPLPGSPRLLAAYSVERFYSSEKAERELGYHSRSAEEIVADMVGWYRAHGDL